jgi:hypothetical protein
MGNGDVFGTLAAVVIALGVFVGLVLLTTFPVMWMFNWLFTPQVIHSVFGVWSLDFWHALVLSSLTGILFKSTITNNSKS